MDHTSKAYVDCPSRPYKARHQLLYLQGGQILRNATTLSVILNIPVRVSNIRAGRSQDGLRPQHLTSIQLLAEFAEAKLGSATVGTTDIEFSPTTIKGGRYVGDTKTAGYDRLRVNESVDKPVGLSQECLLDDANGIALLAVRQWSVRAATVGRHECRLRSGYRLLRHGRLLRVLGMGTVCFCVDIPTGCQTIQLPFRSERRAEVR